MKIKKLFQQSAPILAFLISQSKAPDFFTGWSDWYQARRFAWRDWIRAALTKEELKQAFTSWFRYLDDAIAKLGDIKNIDENLKNIETHDFYGSDAARLWSESKVFQFILANNTLESKINTLKDQIKNAVNELQDKYTALKKATIELLVDFYSNNYDKLRDSLESQLPEVAGDKADTDLKHARESLKDPKKFIGYLFDMAITGETFIGEEIKKIESTTYTNPTNLNETNLLDTAKSAENEFKQSLKQLLDPTNEYFNLIYDVLNEADKNADWARIFSQLLVGSQTGDDMGQVAKFVYGSLGWIPWILQVCVSMLTKLLVLLGYTKSS